jgi:mono/diheme cytochrome c family protein
MDGKGATNGPDLTGSTFTHIDGTFDSMVHIITTGIPAAELKAHANPMPARGGRPTPLTDDQIREVAAYVYSLSHPM